jgi:hypothetical protein
MSEHRNICTLLCQAFVHFHKFFFDRKETFHCNAVVFVGHSSGATLLFTEVSFLANFHKFGVSYHRLIVGELVVCITAVHPSIMSQML